MDYNPASAESILEFAKRLTGKTLAEVVDISKVVENNTNKGDLGSMVERLYFGYRPNSSPMPDFPEAGVELKTTGVNRKSSGGFEAKERLVLGSINYSELVQEEWQNSSLMAKCRTMLILFYLYDKNLAITQRRFIPAPVLFEFPERDLVQIRLDWEIIHGKVASGRAHEISESDTYYLSACRKGSGGSAEKLKTQPNSTVSAKARAFALKVKYVNQIIEGSAREAPSLDCVELVGIEEATRMKFEPYLGMTVAELSSALEHYKRDKNHKGFYRELVMKILGTTGKMLPELERASIGVKTIRVNSAWKPKEAMSFPAFKYLEIVDEDWEESSFYEKLEQKFLFVIFREGFDGALRLEKAAYWNMPYVDREEARRVWEETKRRVGMDARVLPRASESRVAHVRPKARDGNDTLPTPQGTYLVKKCFWLNQNYIADVVRNL